MGRRVVVEAGRGPEVEKVVADAHGARAKLGLEAADGSKAHDLGHALLAQRRDDRLAVDQVRQAVRDICTCEDANGREWLSRARREHMREGERGSERGPGLAWWRWQKTSFLPNLDVSSAMCSTTCPYGVLTTRLPVPPPASRARRQRALGACSRARAPILVRAVAEEAALQQGGSADDAEHLRSLDERALEKTRRMSLADELLADLDDLGTGRGDEEDEEEEQQTAAQRQSGATATAGQKRGRAASGGAGGAGGDGDGDGMEEDGSGSDSDSDEDGGEGGEDEEDEEESEEAKARKARTIGGLDIEVISKANDIHAIAKLIQSRQLVDTLRVRQTKGRGGRGKGGHGAYGDVGWRGGAGCSRERGGGVEHTHRKSKSSRRTRRACSSPGRWRSTPSTSSWCSRTGCPWTLTTKSP